MAAYREPGSVDTTETECAKIREDAETKRKLIEEREETKRKRIQEVGYVPHVCVVLVLGAVILAGSILGYRWMDGKTGTPQCLDRVYRKESYYEKQCEHPLHILVSTEKEWQCKCGKVVLP